MVAQLIMHHFIFPTQDTWISTGSNKVTGTPERDQNFCKDETSKSLVIIVLIASTSALDPAIVV